MTKSELAEAARISRVTLDKAIKTLLTDEHGKKVLGDYKPRIGYSPRQINYITTQLPYIEI